MVKELSRSTKRRRRLKKLLEKYGYLLHLPPKTLPPKHKASLGGGLRCFNKVFPRKLVNGRKIKDKTKEKVRCGNPAVKGSFYCRKHKGGNSGNLKHGLDTLTVATGGLYGRNMTSELGGLLEQFMNDPNIKDLRPELASLRMALSQYLKELTSNETKSSSISLMMGIEIICHDDTISSREKFVQIRDVCASQSFLTDGESLDRLNRIVETISRVMERMHRIQTQDNYFMTPDGFKIFLRSIVDILKQNIKDSKTLQEIRNELMKASVQTRKNVHDAVYRKVDDKIEFEEADYR